MLCSGLRRPTSPPNLPLVYQKQSRQLTEILDAKKVSTSNTNFLWMIRTSIQLLCSSILPNLAHDGGTVIGVHLPLVSIHTHNYLSRKTDNTATCVIVTLPAAGRRHPVESLLLWFSTSSEEQNRDITSSDQCLVQSQELHCPALLLLELFHRGLGGKTQEFIRMAQQQGQNVMRRYVCVTSGYSSTCVGMIHSALQRLGEVEIHSRLSSSRAYGREESTLWIQFLLVVNKLSKEVCELSSSRHLDTSA